MLGSNSHLVASSFMYIHHGLANSKYPLPSTPTPPLQRESPQLTKRVITHQSKNILLSQNNQHDKVDKGTINLEIKTVTTVRSPWSANISFLSLCLTATLRV